MRQTVLKTWRRGAIAALVVFATSSLRATMLIPADLGELASDALAIARGRVASVDASWTADRRGIETIVTLDAEEYLKGGLGPTVRFRVPGGEMGRYRNIVVGAPQFAVGDHVIVFLGTRGPTVPFVLGMGQGVFRVRTSPDGAVLVSPPAVLPAPAGPVVRGSVARQPAPLAQFERDVRSLVARTR